MSKKRKPRSGKKKSGKLTRRPNRSKPDLDRKLSEVILEIAMRLLKNPYADATTEPAWLAALMLAGAAWNSAIGDNAMGDKHCELLDQVDWSRVAPWSELRVHDGEQLIAELVEYKRKHCPDDLPRFVASEMNADGNIRIHWDAPSTVVKAEFGSKSRQARINQPHRHHPIAEKLVKKLAGSSQGYVLDLDALRIGRQSARDLQKTVASQQELAGHNPAHAAYVYAQNQLSLLVEQLTALEEMDRFAKFISRAEQDYMPSGPPMSPLTASFFTCWASFDACVGLAEETLGTTAIAVGATLGMHDELLRLLALMLASRMDVYVHEGIEKDTVLLRELVTERVCRAISPSGYLGNKGELWYVRVLPPPIAAMAELVVFGTPYLLVQRGRYDWQDYFRRTLPDAPTEDRIARFEHHMKFGLARDYWTKFVFEAYLNHRSNVISLAGLPDVPESRPHSSASRG